MSTTSPRPQLNLDELRRLKWLLGGALALVSVWTVFFLDIEALGLVALVSAVIAAAVVWPQLPARVPTLLWRLAVPAIVAAVAADFYFSSETLPVLIRLAVLLVLYRAVAYRRKREDLQLIVLGLFLIVVAGVLTVAVEFALLLLVFTACALGFLFVVTLIDMVDTGPKVMRPEEMREVPAWARGGWPRLFARLRAVADWRLFGFAAALFACVVGFSALLFVLIPRFEIGSSFFLDKYITRKSRTGFTENIRFGSVTELAQDHSVAMRVDLAGGANPPGDLYWRLITLDEYTPEGFRMSAWMKGHLLRSEVFRRVLNGAGAYAAGPAGSGQWTIYVEPGVSRYLPLPGSFHALRLREAAAIQSSQPDRIVALRSEPMTMLAFQLDGVATAPVVRDAGFGNLLSGRVAEAGAREQRRYDPQTMLTGPSGPANEAVMARVLQEITRGERLDAAAFAERATAWLRERHAYALSVNIPRGAGDDIVRWLASNEPGFCEYFAGALAVLSRAAGHPARVVGGFRGGTLNAFENYIMVRNSDAHAWVEVFDGAGRWLRVDPTPGGGGAGELAAAEVAQREQDSSWAARMDTLRVFWYRRIVSFDARQQVELADTVKGATVSFSDALRARFDAWAREFKAWLAGPWDWQRMGRALGLAAGVVLALGMTWRLSGWLRLRWWRWRNPDGFDPVRREAGAQLARLRGLRSSKLQHPNSQTVDADAEWGGVMGDLERLRYGRRETWPEARGVFRRARRLKRR